MPQILILPTSLVKTFERDASTYRAIVHWLLRVLIELTFLDRAMTASVGGIMHFLVRIVGAWRRGFGVAVCLEDIFYPLASCRNAVVKLQSISLDA